METCRLCGSEARYYLDSVTHGHPAGWYCENCLERLPILELKEKAFLNAVVKSTEERLKNKRWLTPKLMKWQ